MLRYSSLNTGCTSAPHIKPDHECLVLSFPIVIQTFILRELSLSSKCKLSLKSCATFWILERSWGDGSVRWNSCSARKHCWNPCLYQECYSPQYLKGQVLKIRILVFQSFNDWKSFNAASPFRIFINASEHNFHADVSMKFKRETRDSIQINPLGIMLNPLNEELTFQVKVSIFICCVYDIITGLQRQKC